MSPKLGSLEGMQHRLGHQGHIAGPRQWAVGGHSRHGQGTSWHLPPMWAQCMTHSRCSACPLSWLMARWQKPMDAVRAWTLCPTGRWRWRGAKALNLSRALSARPLSVDLILQEFEAKGWRGWYYILFTQYSATPEEVPWERWRVRL